MPAPNSSPRRLERARRALMALVPHTRDPDMEVRIDPTTLQYEMSDFVRKIMQQYPPKHLYVDSLSASYPIEHGASLKAINEIIEKKKYAGNIWVSASTVDQPAHEFLTARSPPHAVPIEGHMSIFNIAQVKGTHKLAQQLPSMVYESVQQQPNGDSYLKLHRVWKRRRWQVVPAGSTLSTALTELMEQMDYQYPLWFSAADLSLRIVTDSSAAEVKYPDVNAMYNTSQLALMRPVGLATKKNMLAVEWNKFLFRAKQYNVLTGLPLESRDLTYYNVRNAGCLNCKAWVPVSALARLGWSAGKVAPLGIRVFHRLVVRVLSSKTFTPDELGLLAQRFPFGSLTPEQTMKDWEASEKINEKLEPFQREAVTSDTDRYGRARRFYRQIGVLTVGLEGPTWVKSKVSVSGVIAASAKLHIPLEDFLRSEMFAVDLKLIQDLSLSEETYSRGMQRMLYVEASSRYEVHNISYLRPVDSLHSEDACSSSEPLLSRAGEEDGSFGYAA